MCLIQSVRRGVRLEHKYFFAYLSGHDTAVGMASQPQLKSQYLKNFLSRMLPHRCVASSNIRRTCLATNFKIPV